MFGIAGAGVLAGPAIAATVPAATTVVTANPTQATIGEAVQYTLRATLPAGVTFYSAAIINTVSLGMTPVGSSTVACVSGGIDCTADLPGRGSGYALASSGQRIGWLLGNLPASINSRVVTVVFTARVDDVSRNAIAGNPTNSALVSWNDTSTATAPANAAASFSSSGPAGSALIRVKEPLLSLAATVSDTTPAPGAGFGFTTTVTNANAVYTSSAFAVTVTAAVPSGVVVDTATISSGGTLTGSTLTWHIASIAKNAAVALTWNATLAATGTLSGDALVSTSRLTHYQSLASGGRTYPSAPLSASAAVTPDFPELTVVKTHPGGTIAYAGDPFEWSVAITNSGRSVASSVIVSDDLPVNWTYDVGSATISFDGGTPTSHEPTVSGRDPSTGRVTLSWSGLGMLAVASDVVIRYTATPSSTALGDPGTGSTHLHVNTASALARDLTGAIGSASAPFAGSSSASARIDAADLSLSVSSTAPVAGTASAEAWAATVTNAGPAVATGPFLVTDTPTPVAGMTVVEASGVGWACSVPDSGGAYECSRSDANETLPAGSSFPPIYTSAALAPEMPAGTTLRSTIEVAGRTWDDDLTNNTVIVESTSLVSSDLSVATSLNGAVAAGQSTTWSIDLTNHGPSLAHGPFTVVVAFPAHLTGVTFEGSGWTCDVDEQAATCLYAGDLLLTAAPRLTASAQLHSDFIGDLTTTATLSPLVDDPNHANDTASTTATVSTGTSLLFEKGLDETAIVPGSNSHYSFTVQNSGVADAREVVITDELPSGLTFQSMTAASPGAWQCVETSSAPSTIRCVLTGTIGPGDVESVKVAVHVPSSLVGDVLNTGSVDAANAPAVTDSDDSAVPLVADLGVTTTHSASPVVAGTSVTYRVDVHNYGPGGEPTGVAVVYRVADGLDPVSGSGTGWTCAAPTDQAISCTNSASLPSGASLPALDVVVAIPRDAGPGQYVNVATVKGNLDEPIPDPNSNAAEDETDVTDRAVVTIVRQIAGGEVDVTAGESVEYLIAINNAGPSTADAVVVAGDLPAGFTVTAYSGPGWTCTLATLVCTRPRLAVGTVIITATVTVASDIPDGTVALNSAEVSWADSETERGRDLAVIRVRVHAVADLVLTKTTTSATPSAGSGLDWRLSVRNDGPSDAVGPITITDELPAGIRYLTSSGEWACVAAVVPAADVQPVTCVLGEGTSGLVAAGTAPTLVIATSADPDLGTQTRVNSADAESPTVDVEPTDNSDTATVTFAEFADISVAQGGPSTALIGGTNPFSVIVSNAGPSTVDGVLVTDVLPAGLTYVDAAGSGDGWSCSAAAVAANGETTVSCVLAAPIDPGSDGPVLIIRAAVTAAAYPAVVNSVTVSSTVADPDLRGNLDEATLAISPLVEFTVEKDHSTQLMVGALATYRVEVFNTGPTEDPGGFWVVDTLPPGMAFEGYSGENVTCTSAGNEVTCVFDGSLPTGGVRTVLIRAWVLPFAPDTLVNSVEAGSRYDQLTTTPIVASDTGAVVPGLVILPALANTGVAATLPFLMAIAALLIGIGVATKRVSRIR